MSDTTVTPLRLPVKDRTNAERSRRYRARRKAQRLAATERKRSAEMCALGARLKSGTGITLDDLRLADRLIMALVCLLPRHSTIQLPE